MPWENIMVQALGCPVKDRSFFAWCKMKTNRSVLGKASQSEYESFADEFIRDQFIAGLTSETLHVKLIGKGHRHRDAAQTKVKLQ